MERVEVEEPGDGRAARQGVRVPGRRPHAGHDRRLQLHARAATTSGGSGELIPAYLNRLWTAPEDHQGRPLDVLHARHAVLRQEAAVRYYGGKV